MVPEAGSRNTAGLLAFFAFSFVDVPIFNSQGRQ
jgi:hypothetical protein